MDAKQQNLSVDKIEEALDLLQQAAREKKNELKNLVLDKYSELKDTLFDDGNGFAQNISATAARATEGLRHARQVGRETMQGAVAKVDQEVRTNPWSYLGGIAVGALVLGYLFGRREQE